ncbi:hypothetical protein [Algirhabdus cladophorae]|uniref:hypothetical protein n=1 Tax=Algirhabdus cladophorae TaxID=3377108 RepID=UPI003B84ACCB
MSDLKHITDRVEADRAQLAVSLKALSDTVHPQKLSKELTAAANAFGGDLASKAWDTLRENPAGGLLVTLGLGLMANGTQHQSASAKHPTPTAAPPKDAMNGFDERVAQADAQMRSEMTGKDTSHPEASRLQAALDYGLDSLPPKARQRVIKARQAVVSTQETIEHRSRKAAQKTKSFAHAQPLTAGALALGFGVLAGSLLPNTRREDELLGRKRDTLMANARNILEDELLKAKSQAKDMIARQSGAAIRERRG